ncbi:hypothetical protein EJB05_10375 [Eragrostis curvula]|uniref:RING-type E3 ubiquitin transferase n=1 Tax=Eragrostis curvula TaxID=38414 RepID=A0A5J9VNR6_9POAL|nr:hypothetical protein EJB05_10375 [Eragrostis curvula]
MEILSPSPPPSPCPAVDNQLHRRLRYGGRREHHLGEAWVHVAVGRSPEKTLGLLRWTLRRFQCGRIALVHIHQPSPLIPTLLGKIPAGQATEELVLSHRKSEKEEMNRILLSYLAFCHRAQVQATLLVTENDQIHDGILTLVNQYGITKLVMGSTPDHCFKLKASYGKESLMARNAPAFCEIWFVWRGRHIWTREASAATDNNVQDDVMTTKRIRFTSYSNNAESLLDEGYITCETSVMADLNQDTASNNDPSSEYDAIGAREGSHFYNMSVTNWRDAESELNSNFWSDPSVHMETLRLYSTGILDRNLKEVMMEAEESRKEAFVELLKRKETESNVASAFSRAKVSDSAKKHEMKMREDVEISLVATKKQHEELIKIKEKAAAGLESSVRRLAILDARAKKISLRMGEVAAELEVIQSSIETLRQEKSKVQRQEERHIDQIVGCRCSHATLQHCTPITPGDNSYSFRELTLLDMQSATCNFSEGLKLRSQGHGCVYKGEIMDKSVMIHKLHSDSIQSLKQFQQEVHILSKVRHPHLVSLIGACPEALCLVYEYLPSVSLHERLFSKCNSHQLSWKIRARIIAEISSALLFLHSCKPHTIIHGDLKLENILVDTGSHCKIADFGISRIFADDMKHYLSSCADPEYQRTKVLTPKSDIYYFGIVVLQLLTGKQEPVGLATEVRRAVSCGKLSSVLDKTAGDWPMEVAGRLAELGIQCSEASSRDRPELTPGTIRDLERLYHKREEHIPSSFLCPILKASTKQKMEHLIIL